MRTNCYLLAFLFFLGVLCVSCGDDDYANISGEGTAENPYVINNVASLIHLAELINEGEGDYNKGKYILTADLDLANIGGSEGWVPIGTQNYPFEGEFDGNGHVIKNLIINRRSGYEYQGLFGYSKGNIKGINLVDMSINAYGYVGGIAGWSNGLIQTCSVSGTVKGTSSLHGSVGGLVGYNGATIRNCYTNGSVSGSGGSLNLTNYVGGLVGRSTGSIYNSYSSADVSVSNTGDYYAFIGGLVGSASRVSSGLSSGKTIKGSGKKVQCGKVAGSYTSLTDCFANKAMTVTGNTQPYIMDGLKIKEITFSEMYKEEFYVNDLGWDIDHIWLIQENDLPILR